jgi:hypothetical protein
MSAVADDDHDGDRQKRVFRAQLAGLNEVPSVSTQARGQFYAVLREDANGEYLEYWLSFSDLTANVSQAHIHFGQHHTNGGIIVWLCQGSLRAPTTDTEECGGPRTSAVNGVIRPAHIIGPAGQGIAATEFSELLAAMRAGAAYANVHSVSATTPPGVQFPGGEIRGQIH